MTHAELAAAGIVVTPDEHARLARLVSCLLDENTRINLTGIRDPQRAWVIHVCDSLALLPWLRERRPATLIDVGSGGGMPGLPIACVASWLHVTLLDATRKKVDASLRIARAVGLENVRGVWGRAERVSRHPEFRGHFDVATVRAVAALPQALTWAAGFLGVAGHAWFYVSARDAEQASQAAQAAVQNGVRALDQVRYTLPEPGGQRVLLCYGRPDVVRDKRDRSCEPI